MIILDNSAKPSALKKNFIVYTLYILVILLEDCMAIA